MNVAGAARRDHGSGFGSPTRGEPASRRARLALHELFRESTSGSLRGCRGVLLFLPTRLLLQATLSASNWRLCPRVGDSERRLLSAEERRLTQDGSCCASGSRNGKAGTVSAPVWKPGYESAGALNGLRRTARERRNVWLVFKLGYSEEPPLSYPRLPGGHLDFLEFLGSCKLTWDFLIGLSQKQRFRYCPGFANSSASMADCTECVYSEPVAAVARCASDGCGRGRCFLKAKKECPGLPASFLPSRKLQAGGEGGVLRMVPVMTKENYVKPYTLEQRCYHGEKIPASRRRHRRIIRILPDSRTTGVRSAGPARAQ